MKPEKLKSGNWRCKVYLGTDENGKKLFKSVTAPTKKEAIAKAAELALDDKKLQQSKLTVGYCIDAYIREKESELSPHTVQGYKAMARIRFDTIRDIPITELATRDIQLLMTELYDLSPKTKKNVLGLLTASLRYFEHPIDTSGVKIGRKKKERIKTPTHAQVSKLISASNGELRLAILLGALCGLRRGEIFALNRDNIDLERKQLYVGGALVKATGVRDIRAPKTETSNRFVDMPDLVAETVAKHMNNEDGFLFTSSMDAIMTQWRKLRDSLSECEAIRFHDLRHYYASALIAAGVPDIYAMKMGGWATPGTLKRVYQDVFADQYDVERNKVNSIFNNQFK